LLIQKFDYPNLSRKSVEGRRLYATPTGHRVPSVTTILEATKSEEKKAALNNWRKNVGAIKAKQITEEAANHGTSMHKKLEQYMKGELLPPGTNPIQQVTHKMAELVISKGLVNVSEAWGLEAALYYEGLYAGTTDCCGIWKGHEAIIDFKQSNKVKKEAWIEDYYVQLAAYALAHNRMFDTKIKTGVVMMCVRSEPPQYLEFDLTGTKFAKYEDMWWNKVEQYYKEN
jgi:ATP-dependent exoDNAse (exonuclease V) beta subunit